MKNTEAVIPNYWIFKKNESNNQSILNLKREYFSGIEVCKKRSIIDLLNDKLFYESRLRRVPISDPNLALVYFDDLRIIQYCLIIKPIKDLKKAGFSLVKKRNAAKSPNLKKLIDEELTYLSDCITKAINYQKR